MDKSNTEMAVRSSGVMVVPHTELAPLHPVRSKFLWLDPFNFSPKGIYGLKVINAPRLAAWAMEVATWRRPALPDIHKRGPKPTYTDVSVLLMALIQVAWTCALAGLSAGRCRIG